MVQVLEFGTLKTKSYPRTEDRRREPCALREEVRLVNPGTDFKYLGDLITCLWFLPSVPAVRCPREGPRLAASCAGTPGARKAGTRLGSVHACAMC